MSNATRAGLFGGLGTLATGFGLEGLTSHTLQTQTLVEAYLAKAGSVDAGTVNDAYMFASNSLGNSILPTALLFSGSICLGMAAYDLAKSYARKG